jgi:hypothetical protein
LCPISIGNSLPKGENLHFRPVERAQLLPQTWVLPSVPETQIQREI